MNRTQLEIMLRSTQQADDFKALLADYEKVLAVIGNLDGPAEIVAMIFALSRNRLKVQFAQTVLEAQTIREDSYIDLGDTTKNVQRSEYESYSLTHDQAAERACVKLGLPSELAQVIGLLNYSVWNDVQMWAENTIESSNKES